jgi:hypothetical protein
MTPLTALAVINNATNIAFTLAASIIIARLPNRPARTGLLEQEAANRHRFSFLRRHLRAATESSPEQSGIRSFRGGGNRARISA